MSVLATVKKNVDIWYNQKFDDRQRAAVDGILDSWSAVNSAFILPIIDGPPGTGKTTVGAVACAKYLMSGLGNEIVYMCYTNVACERAKRTLYKALGMTFFPPGIPPIAEPVNAARVYAGPVKKNWDSGVVSLKNMSDMDKNYLKMHNVILCTLASANWMNRLRNRPKIVVDEFSQVNPSDFFAAVERICRGKKNPDGFALIGDPIQLPVVTTQPALRPNIATLILTKKPHAPHELEIQYRMHEHICEAVNEIRTTVYHAPKLKSAPHVKNQTLRELKYTWDPKRVASSWFEKILNPNHPLVIINTDATGKEEKGFGESTKNNGEAKLVVEIARQVHESFASDNPENPEVVKILTPYSAQDELIKELLAGKLGSPTADWSMTIHKAQGQEFPCVIISFVRNNDDGDIGFMKEDELRAQTYVAISRAQAKLIILMSFKTFLRHGHADFEALFNSPHALKVDKCPSL